MEDLISGHYPKFQYSVFLSGTKEPQLVIRADSWEEFKELKEKADQIINKVKPDAPAEETMVCAQCGANAEYKEGTSKAGKPWKAVFCSDNKDHVKWL